MVSTRFCTYLTIAAMALFGGREGPGMAQSLPAQHIPTVPVSTAREATGAIRRRPVQSVQFPIAFEEAYAGQHKRSEDFLAQGPGYRLTLSPLAATFQLTTPSKPAHSKPTLSKGASLPVTETLAMQLIGADAAAHAVQNLPPTGHANYILGKDTGKWRTEVPLYSRVQYDQVYPGIDLAYYGNRQQLEYDFLVRPHTDPKRIGLKFGGARKVRIAANGDLVLGMKQGEVRWHKPVSYQTIAGQKRSVASAFVLKNGGEVGFQLARYDTSRSLTIDPPFHYSTLLGDKTGSSTVTGLAIDAAGNTYVTGTTGATDFPVSLGAFQKTSNHSAPFLTIPTAFVAKLDPTGSTLLYATYLGGSYNDNSNGIAIDSQGCAYITGFTYSTDFPVTPGAFQTTNSAGITGSNAFVTKLNPAGSALVYSTYLGGHLAANSNRGDTGYGIAVDSQGSAYVAGVENSIDFPTTPGAFVTTPQSQGNGFITKLNSAGSALAYSTYLTGYTTPLSAPLTYSECLAIALDSAGNAYVTGDTSVPNFPTTPGAFEQPPISSFSGPYAFVTKMNATGTKPIYSTYVVGHTFYHSGSNGYGIAVDPEGNATITGSAYVIPALLTPGAVNWIQSQGNPLFELMDAVVVKLNATGTGLIYFADIGRGTGYSCATDSAGNVSVTGITNAVIATTIGAFQRSLSGSDNTFVTRLNTNGTALLYGTYLGGTQGNSVAVDNLGNLTAGGSTRGGFATTPNAYLQSKDAAANIDYGFMTRIAAHAIYPDFNGDGNADLLYRNRLTGEIGTWLLNGPHPVGGVAFAKTPPSTYSLIGVGDFTGQGIQTLVFQNSADNGIVFWNTAGPAISATGTVSQSVYPGWKLMAVADLDGDGRSDLLFQYPPTGQIVLWMMNGLDFKSGVINLPNPGKDWKVAGTGDFNGDGFPDIVFQNQTTGQLKIWFMQGATFVSESAVTTQVQPYWSVVGVGDYDGDGRADLVFQNQITNRCVVWYMNGAVQIGGSQFSQDPLPNWSIVGPR